MQRVPCRENVTSFASNKRGGRGSLFRTTSRVSFYSRVAKEGVAAESRKGTLNLPNFPSPTLLSPSNDPISIFDNDIIPNDDEFRTILESSSRSDRVSKSRDNESPFNPRSTIRFERRDNMAKNDSLMESLARFFPFYFLLFFYFPSGVPDIASLDRHRPLFLTHPLPSAYRVPASTPADTSPTRGEPVGRDLFVLSEIL